MAVFDVPAGLDAWAQPPQHLRFMLGEAGMLMARGGSAAAPLAVPVALSTNHLRSSEATCVRVNLGPEPANPLARQKPSSTFTRAALAGPGGQPQLRQDDTLFNSLAGSRQQMATCAACSCHCGLLYLLTASPSVRVLARMC